MELLKLVVDLLSLRLCSHPTLFLNLDRWTWKFVQDKWTYWNVARRVDTTFNIGRKAGKDIIIPTLKMKCQGLGVVEQPPKVTQ